MKHKIKKTILSALIFATVNTLANSYVAVLKKNKYSVKVNEEVEEIATNINSVCNIKFILNRGGDSGAVMSKLTIETDNGQYDYGNRISSKKLVGIYENATITSSDTWSNSDHYYPAVILETLQGEWSMYLGRADKSTIEVTLNNEANISSISYADLWITSSNIYRHSINTTIELRNCSGDLLKSKYIENTLSNESLKPEIVTF